MDRSAEFAEQRQSVFAQSSFVRVDGDFFEEGIHWFAEFRERAHGFGEIFRSNGGGGFLVGAVEGGFQGALLIFRNELDVGACLLYTSRCV